MEYISSIQDNFNNKTIKKFDTDDQNMLEVLEDLFITQINLITFFILIKIKMKNSVLVMKK